MLSVGPRNTLGITSNLIQNQHHGSQSGSIEVKMTPMISYSGARDLEFTILLIKKLKGVVFSPSQSLTLEVKHRCCINVGI
jgi:hypothetical protein